MTLEFIGTSGQSEFIPDENGYIETTVAGVPVKIGPGLQPLAPGATYKVAIGPSATSTEPPGHDRG